MASLASLRRWLRNLWQHRKRHFLKNLYVATVVASVIHIFNAVDLPLELPATTLLASVATVYKPDGVVASDVRRHLAVVEIDEKRHRESYGGESPLNRCQLKQDIATLLRIPKLEALAIDFDLSPVDPTAYALEKRRVIDIDLSALEPAAARRPRCEWMTDVKAFCQCELEALLAEPSAALSPEQRKQRELLRGGQDSPKIIAIEPLVSALEQASGAAKVIRESFPTVQFGSPELRLRFGMVHDYSFPPSGYAGAEQVPFAELMAQAVCAKSAEKQPIGCEQVRLSARSAASPVNPTSIQEFRRYPISHFQTRFLYDGGVPLPFGHPCLKAAKSGASTANSDECDIRFVIFGGSYGAEDRYLTPKGVMPGVQVHAAIAAQVRSHTWHGWGFLADVALGVLLFGPLVHYFWERYFRQRAQLVRAAGPWQHPKLAYLWLLQLTFWLALSIFLLILLSAWVYGSRGIWISPVPVALAMLVEAVVTGSVHVANHVIRDVQTTLQNTAHGALPAEQPGKRTAALTAMVPRAAAIGLIGTAGFLLTRELFV